MSPTPPLALSCRSIRRHFGTVQALAHADLAVTAGTIHALVGENGAGKSTLMSIVSGLLPPDAGDLEVFGRPAQFRSPLQAAAAGIGMVHQHFLLAEALTVAENIALGRPRSPWGWRFPRQTVEAEIEALAAQSGLAINPRARVGDLPVGLRQRVEILKALARGARILLLDEPTAILAPPEVESLFATLRRLQAEGRTIVLITHKLDEVFALAAEVTVLRQGRTVHAGPLANLRPAELAFHMVGQKQAPLQAPPCAGTLPLLEVRNLGCPGAGGRGLEEATFDLLQGEILGLAGVEGNGQDELAGALAGTLAARPNSTIRLQGQELVSMSIRQRARAGLAVIPGDRQREGLVLELNLAENLQLREPLQGPGGAPGPGRPPVRFGRRAQQEARAAVRLEEFGIQPPLPGLSAGSLSGGNQQKLVLARELAGRPAVILAHHPSRGLDVAATAAVHARLLRAARQEGAAVLLISSDLDEIEALSDRVGVLYRGRLRILGSRGLGRRLIGAAMVGTLGG